MRITRQGVLTSEQRAGLEAYARGRRTPADKNSDSRWAFLSPAFLISISLFP